MPDGDKIVNLGTYAPGGGGFSPISHTFTVLPRGRKTLKERLINKLCHVGLPKAIRAEVVKRLDVTQADIDKMTEEERAAFHAKANEIAGDILSGLTLKQVLNLMGSDTYSPKDGDTLRANIVAMYSKSSGDAEISDPGTPTHSR